MKNIELILILGWTLQITYHKSNTDSVLCHILVLVEVVLDVLPDDLHRDVEL